MKRIFIDGSAGTTGLRIRERLTSREDLEVTVLPDEVRKDVSARRDALNAADVAFLCLPDAAAVEAVRLVENPETVIIDTSTAHRTAAGWEYGFPELDGRRTRLRTRLRTAKRIANPGCHASGFIALVAPLVRSGVIAPDAPLAAYSLTGYSGGGKKMIAAYDETPLFGGRAYALGQTHKHLPEMVAVCGLKAAPVFSPIVVPHYSGMATTVMVSGAFVKGGLAAARECLRAAYQGERIVRYAEDPSDGGIVSSTDLSGRDDLEVSVFGNDERLLLVSRFDNLGKGASGAAIQNMNLVLDVDETCGLSLG